MLTFWVINSTSSQSQTATAYQLSKFKMKQHHEYRPALGQHHRQYQPALGQHQRQYRSGLGQHRQYRPALAMRRAKTVIYIRYREGGVCRGDGGMRRAAGNRGGQEITLWGRVQVQILCIPYTTVMPQVIIIITLKTYNISYIIS